MSGIYNDRKRRELNRQKTSEWIHCANWTNRNSIQAIQFTASNLDFNSLNWIDANWLRIQIELHELKGFEWIRWIGKPIQRIESSIQRIEISIQRIEFQFSESNFNSHALSKTLLGVTKIGAVGNSRNCYWNSEMDTSETPKWDEMKRENSALAELRTCNCEKNWGNAAMCRGLDHTIPCLLANMCTWFIVEKVANNVNGIAWGCTLFVVEKSRKECQRDLRLQMITRCWEKSQRMSMISHMIILEEKSQTNVNEIWDCTRFCL